MNRRHEMLVALQHLDVMIREVKSGHDVELGFKVENLDALVKSRASLARKIDPEDLKTYERVAQRYDHVSAVVPVQNKNCLGCFMDLPTAATRAGDADDGLMVCENCGRILYWV